MTGRQIIVGWCAVLPIDDLDWRDTLDYVIEELQGEYGRIIRPASPHDSEIDVLFISYLAVDHWRILDEGLVGRKLLEYPQILRSVILTSCGKENSAQEVSPQNVRELLIRPNASTSIDLLSQRTGSVDLFKDNTRKHLIRYIKRKGMIDTNDAIVESATESLTVGREGNALKAEYLL